MDSIAFLFSGQGAQHKGMMKELFEHSSAAQVVFNTADRVLGRSITDLCFTGSQEELNLTHNTQPCILAADLAAYAALIEQGIMPGCVAGFSLGEYAALVAAGVISMEDAFKIVQIRADSMQEAVPVGQGAMAAVLRISSDEVTELCTSIDGYVIAANFNSPGQTVISGESNAVAKLLAKAKERKIKAIMLPVSAPFHCKLMEPARRKLEEMFHSVKFSDASIPVFMNFDGNKHLKADDIRQSVLAQTISPVKWIDTIQNINASGVSMFIELGPGNTLNKFCKKILVDGCFYSVESYNELQILTEIIKI